MKPKSAAFLIASAVVGLGLAVTSSFAADTPSPEACVHAKDGDHHCMHRRSIADIERGKAGAQHDRMHERMHDGMRKNDDQHGKHDRHHRGGKHHGNCHGDAGTSK